MVPLAIAAFIAAQIAMGYWASRRVRNKDDFLVAGRRLGPLVAGFSLFITWFGAESILGSSAAIRAGGLAGGRADPLGYALSLLLFGFFFAAPLWRTGALTLADAYRERFGVRTQQMAALVMIPPSVLWLAAQLRALGQIVSIHTPLSVQVAILVATGLAILYTVLGGLLGDVITDVVQGVIVIVGLVVTLFILVAELGGWEMAFSQVTSKQLQWIGDGESATERINVWFVPIIGALIAQESVSRAFACRTAEEARKASLFAGGLYLLFGAVPVLLGLFGAHYALNLTNSEDFLLILSQNLLGPIAHVFFLCAIVSVILSSVDSALLAIAALATQDLSTLSKKERTPDQTLRFARICLLFAGLAGGGIALSGSSIYDLVLQADALGTSGICVVTIGALFTKFGGPRSAFYTLLTGLLSSLLFKYILDTPAPFLSSLAASILCYFAVGLIERKRCTTIS